MATKTTRQRVGRIGLTTALLLLTASSVQAGAEAPGEIVNNDGKLFKGLISYRSSEKVYNIRTVQGASDSSITVPQASVKPGYPNVVEPPELRQAVQLVQNNKLPEAIVLLDNVAKDYSMLKWDVRATRLLAEAYLRDNKPELAAKACERLIDKRPEAATTGDLISWYWQALLASGRYNKLEDLLNTVDKSGAPEAQARANVLRGEMLGKQNKSKDALRYGYLRTIVLFKNWRDPAVREARAEALFKAAQCFDVLGTSVPASKMRMLCLGEHADSEWARRLKAGER